MSDPRADAGTVVRHAGRALSEVADLAPDQVAVLGDGALAALIRQELGGTATLDDTAAPMAVIETTGTASSIALAIQRVASVGRVVLIAEPETPHVDVRTYADIHVRGISVIGIRDQV